MMNAMEYPGDGSAMPRHITVQVRNVYGNDLVYPVDDAALQFAALIGAKTFGAKQLGLIKALGYGIHVAAGQLPAHWARILAP